MLDKPRLITWVITLFIFSCCTFPPTWWTYIQQAEWCIVLDMERNAHTRERMFLESEDL